MQIEDLAPWPAAWLWSLPLIVLNVIIHVAGLLAIDAKFTPLLHRYAVQYRLTAKAMAILAVIVTSVILLHAFEAAVWAAAYYALGAFPAAPPAMLYSIEALTTYGHTLLSLPHHWRMMGALEALNGLILFGLTTAFLFMVLQSTALFSSRSRDDTRDADL